ncbi:hypothetical protein SAMN05444377_11412 [Flavobacterium fontis]|uniref:Uncharacterized protein n=1 Tax=Flavobacterium fontis TaxID=1124188 RepID=A0A1M5D735_9FLAO|nr:hypothetical protein [Flavobacterium fontis]SHF62492.1 hypothetical protein SAMN05444377_11412 [Flavobacterium fontis]
MKRNYFSALIQALIVLIISATVVYGIDLTHYQESQSKLLLILLTLAGTFLVYQIGFYKKEANQSLCSIYICVTLFTCIQGITIPYLRKEVVGLTDDVALLGAAWMLAVTTFILFFCYIHLPKNMKLSSRELYLSIVLGIVFWMNGVLVINLIGAYLLTDANVFLGMGFLLTIPITLVSILIIKRIIQLPFRQLYLPLLVMTGTATFFDSTFLLFAHDLYHSKSLIAFHGACLILWGAGLGYVILFIYDKRTANAM